MKITRLAAGIIATALLFCGASAQAQDKPEKPDIVLGVGGKSSLYYLPLTLAERLGYFKEQGLNVTITDFGGGSKSLQSLIGGSADVVTGAYEHTIRMQSKGQNIAAVIELGRFPGMVLAVKKSKAAQVKTFGDLKGMKIGVTAPGSSTNFFVNALIARDGVKPDEVSIVGVGTGLSAVAAIQKGDIDAICNIDPVITKLEQTGDIVILADSRTDADNMKLFGGNNPAAVAYFKTDFIAKNPVTVQRLVNAFYKAVKWLEKASPEDIAAWRKEVGIPDTPDGYKIEPPKGVVFGDTDKPMLSSFAAHAHANNWDQKTLNDAISWYGQHQEAQLADLAAKDDSFKVEATDQLREMWPGQEYYRNTNAAKSFINTLPKDFQDLFATGRTADGRIMGDHPVILATIAQIAREVNPAASVVPAGTQDAPKAIDTELSQLRTMMRDASGPYHRGPEAAKNQARYRELLNAQEKMKGRAA